MTTKTVADLSALTGANTDVADLFLIWDTSAGVHKYVTRAELYKMPQTWAVDMLFTDATYDIGKSGATRPRDGFFSRNGVFGGTLGVGAAGLVGSNGTKAQVSADVVDSNAERGQFVISGSTDSNKQLWLGYDTTSDFGFIQAVKSGTAIEPLYLNKWGGDVRFGANLYPTSDNAYSLGTASYRASVVYAGTGTINTSGRATKRNIRKRTDAEARVAKTIRSLGCFWQFADAVAAKGADKARFHFGVIAEDIRDAFVAEGLDPHRYAMFCEDELVESETYMVKETREKIEEVEEVERTIEVVDGKPVLTETKVLRKRPVGEWRAVTSESGSAVMAATPETDDKGTTILAPMMHFVPEMEEYETEATREVKTGEKRLGLRYDQLTLFVLLNG